MGWKLSLGQKIRTGSALIVVFLLVVATNLMDSNHFRLVQQSLTTMYEDRLLAKDYIYRIARQLDIKKEVIQTLESNELQGINSSVNDSIQSLITLFAATELTERELNRFESLKENLNLLLKYEREQSEKLALDQDTLHFQKSKNIFFEIYSDLDALSQIQIEEGKKEIDISNRTINTSNLISRLEIGILIVIGLLIQMLIFMKPLK